MELVRMQVDSNWKVKHRNGEPGEGGLKGLSLYHLVKWRLRPRSGLYTKRAGISHRSLVNPGYTYVSSSTFIAIEAADSGCEEHYATLLNSNYTALQSQSEIMLKAFDQSIDQSNLSGSSDPLSPGARACQALNSLSPSGSPWSLFWPCFSALCVLPPFFTRLYKIGL